MSYTRFPTRFGRYILLDRIASGGMAEVYRAKTLDLGQVERLIAIKCILPQYYDDEQFVTMFVDEAKLAAQLSHENIVGIHELGRVHNRLYIAMELVSGHDAKHVIRTARAVGRSLPVPFAAYVVSKAALALDHAHNKRAPDGKHLELVHRDVSPQNIMIGFDGAVKVTDFGIARAAVRDTGTQAGVIKGKVGYMAPEQVTDTGIDRRTDIFALGAVLFELVSGRRAFSGESPFAVLEKVRAADFGEISDIPLALREVLQRAMALCPDDRFLEAADMAEALSPFRIEGKSIYGAKGAAGLMQLLYGDEIECLPEKRREYAAINPADLFEDSEQRRRPDSVELFESLASQTDADAEATQAMASRADATGASPASSDATGALPASSDATGASRAFLRLPSKLRGLPVNGALLVSTSIVAGALAILVVARGTQPEAAGTELLPGAAPVAVAKPVATPHPAQATARRPVAPAALPVDEPPVGVPIAVGARVATSPAAQAEGSRLAPSVPLTKAESSPPAEPAAEAAAVGASKSPAMEEPAARLSSAGQDAENYLAVEEKLGVVTIKARGVHAARIVVDGVDIGFSPVVYREIEVGEHIVEIVEEVNGELGRTKTVIIAVEPKHTREAPLKVFVDF